VRFTQWALRPDSGGPGLHRGGLGAIYEIAPLMEGDTDVFLLGERGKFPPFGVNGGKSAALNRFSYRDASGEHGVPLVTKTTDVKIDRAGFVRLESPGGGGFGDPRRRDPSQVARDVRFGYVTRESATAHYAVALRADGSVDDGATAELRSRA
jgi:N-methylhydantoinase B